MVWRGESGWVDAGFHTEGGGLEFPPPPPEILKLSMVIIVVPSILAIMLLDISMCHQMLLHIIIQFSNATNVMLHRMSCCTGCHVAPDVTLHRKSCCTQGVR